MKQNNREFVLKLSTFIVDKRNLIFLFFILATIFSAFSFSWVEVQEDITVYLDENTMTRQGVTEINKEFVTLGMADIMLSNITYEQAEKVYNEISEIDGIMSVMFENTNEYYKDSTALISVTFSDTAESEVTLSAMDKINDITKSYDVSVKSSIGFDMIASLAEEMAVITILAAIIIFLVLIFTSKSFGEIPVLFITFGVAAILNMGTNFIFGEISFMSNSVAVVLQLALAVDYAIIFCHRFTEEREHLNLREACITALSKAIPEVFSSSLTTISGLFALSFMTFQIGEDLSFVMIKSILCSLITVFALMPGLLMIFDKLMTKTKHRNFVPSMRKLGNFAIKTRFIVPPIFLLITILAIYFSGKIDYQFGISSARAVNPSESQLQTDRVNEKFGIKNMLAILVPKGDYESEKELVEKFESYDEVDSVLSLANTEISDGYFLSDALTAREFSEFANIDYEQAQLLFTAYALNDEDYANTLDLTGNYTIPFAELMFFIMEAAEEGYLDTLSGISGNSDMMSELTENMGDEAEESFSQIQSENYSRIVLFLNLPEEGQETYEFLDVIESETRQYYDTVYMVGNSTSTKDLSSTFTMDNAIISILSALFVMLVLLLTFKSTALSVLLIVLIQSAIWTNFSLPYFQGMGVYFLGYLIVSAIQMGANVDYAIVLTSRYLTAKETMPKNEAVITALDQAFPTIFTSGSIMTSAGIIIQYLSSDGSISSLGGVLGRGTFISMVLVVFVLPQLLYLGTTLIEKTSFSMKTNISSTAKSGKISMRGHIKGQISGFIDAKVEGRLIGDFSGVVKSDNDIEEAEENEEK